MASAVKKFADAMGILTSWDVSHDLVVQVSDVVFGKVSVWLSVMPSAVPLFPTVTWSCVLHGHHVMTTASSPSLSLSPFNLPLATGRCQCWCFSGVLGTCTLCTGWDALRGSIRS